MISPREAAFPEPVAVVNERVEFASYYTDKTGLTIRAYIAAKVLNGLLSNQDAWAASEGQLAEMAVKHADALIAELNKPTK